MKHLAIFASGNGSNAENIIRFFNTTQQARVLCVLTNNPNAGVLERCKALNVETLVFNKTTFTATSEVLDVLKNLNLDLIILAGFLWKFPTFILKVFPDKVINIHPALLPKYGGKGMYGKYVHQAIVQNKERETGITIHYVNEHYDEGKVIFQAKCLVDTTDTPADVAAKVHELELHYFPKVIESLLF